ncbi:MULTISPECIES: pilus assembly protein TadG-related protein [unclassified Sphingomonas]|uniref:pilus assembly protein TadG-related protein n=2 Tax=Sphingomonas TaxID=13687 RepID=UPI000A603177|nr:MULTISPECIES: pilus assembly protein TadG-related protein [unclassified Sphingomonas]
MAFHARRMIRDARGGVALIGALSLTTLVGMGAFAVEATRGYAADATNQRIADSAALAGALAYNVNNNASEMTATAKAVVVAQGLPASAATVALVTDSATAKQLVRVTVTTSVPLALGRVFTAALAYDVTAVGSATTTTTTTTAPPCIAALSSTPSYGITMSGGTSLSAPGCAIDTNAGITVPWGTYITAKQANAGKSVDNPGKGLTTSPTANNIAQNKANAASDWMKDNTALKTALCQVNKLTGGTDADYADYNTACLTPLVTPTSYTNTSTEDWNLNYSPAPNVAGFRTGNSTYVIPSSGTLRQIRTLTLAGGITAAFQGPVDLRINAVDMSGNGLTIGDGDVIVISTFGFNSGNTITIGNGNHSFGSLAVTGGRTLNIGTGNLNVTGAITMDGGSYIYANVSVGNTVAIGNNGTNAISIGGGSKLCFAGGSGGNCSAPSAAAGTFSANGQVSTSGGSTIVFPKATTHVINGDLSLNGSSTFGSGTYVIKGGFTNNTGGTMAGTDVTFALGGTFTLSGGTSLDLSAPGAGASYGIPGLLIATKTSAATLIGGGSGNKYAGLLYAPRSDLTLKGGASMSAYGSNCLMMILNTLSLLEGGAASTGTCSGLSGSSSSTANVALFK